MILFRYYDEWLSPDEEQALALWSSGLVTVWAWEDRYPWPWSNEEAWLSETFCCRRGKAGDPRDPEWFSVESGI